MTASLEFLTEYAYLVLMLSTFAQQIGLPIPSTPVLLAAGALAQSGRVSFSLSVLLATIGAIVADHCWYEIGRWQGSKVLNLLCRISLEPDYCVRRTENAFAKRGARTLIFAKFIPGVSAIATPMAGINRLSRSRFFALNTIGTILWIASFEWLGYLFSDQLTQLLASISQVGGALFAVCVGGLFIYVAWKYTQRRLFLRRLRIARISPVELKQQIDAGEEVFIVDLRHETEFQNEPQMIPGARRLVLEDIEQHAADIPRDRHIVLYCT